MKLFDTHAHCDDKRYEAEYEGGTHKLILDSFENGVGYIVNIGTSVENSKDSLALAEKYENVYAACGIHPSEVFYEDVNRAVSEIEELLKHKKAVALGEIGLDYHYEHIPRDLQMVYFEKQLALAKRLNIPVIIHDRDAHGDCMEVVRRFPGVKGIFHSFSGSSEMARELTSLGWYISFSGTVTFKNARVPKEACVVVPTDKLLIETDAPYLPPVPHRGELNKPYYVSFTAQMIADLRGTTIEEIEKITTENAKRIFGIS